MGVRRARSALVPYPCGDREAAAGVAGGDTDDGHGRRGGRPVDDHGVGSGRNLHARVPAPGSDCGAAAEVGALGAPVEGDTAAPEEEHPTTAPMSRTAMAANMSHRVEVRSVSMTRATPAVDEPSLT